MRIRAGFVSNSSSSSFIIRFPEEITSKEQLATYVEKDALVNDKYYNFDAVKLSEAVEWVLTCSNRTITLGKWWEGKR